MAKCAHSHYEITIFPHFMAQLRRVSARNDDTIATYLAKFESAAGDLQPGEGIHLFMNLFDHEKLKALKLVLLNPFANKIFKLNWAYSGYSSIDEFAQLIADRCPQLFELDIEFNYHSETTFVISMLKHPKNKLVAVRMHHIVGDSTELFSALGKSRVTSFYVVGDLHGHLIHENLSEFLAKDMLVNLRLTWTPDTTVPSSVLAAMARCKRLKWLQMVSGTFECAEFAKSLEVLRLHRCRFNVANWVSMVGGNLKMLMVDSVSIRTCSPPGHTLVEFLGERRMDEVRILNCHFGDETIEMLGRRSQLGRIKSLHLGRNGDVSTDAILAIALALKVPNNEMRDLTLAWPSGIPGAVQDCLAVALNQPNCALSALDLCQLRAYRRVDVALTKDFRGKCVLFCLLQGRQRRFNSPLQRLPVEMFRMVGALLFK